MFATLKFLQIVLTACFVRTSVVDPDHYTYPSKHQEVHDDGGHPPIEYSDGNDEDISQKEPFEEEVEYPPKETLSGRAFKKGDTFKWKKFNIYFESEEFSKADIKQINGAAHVLNKILEPCGVPVRIYEGGEKPAGDYVKLVKGSGCVSSVGRRGGEQIMVMGQPRGSGRVYCMYRYLIVHEFLHALGFEHEHNRPDRDEYVEVLWDNIKPQLKHNFEIPNGSDTLGIPYNPNSVMHYEDWMFVKKYGLKSMKSKIGKYLGWIGNPNDPLGSTDREMIKKVYCT